jgi:hypothetical protein
MNYNEAFELAVKRNAETRHAYFIYKMIWTNEYLTDACYTPSWAPSYPNAVLIGEVRRMTPR